MDATSTQSRAGNFNPLFPYGKRRDIFVCPPQIENFNPLFPYGKRHSCQRTKRWREYFNPLFPYGKRLFPSSTSLIFRRISIHSSHTGRDWRFAVFCSRPVSFQSTLPIREETAFFMPSEAEPVHFNPLFPYGKRPGACAACSPLGLRFQSTLPIREETKLHLGSLHTKCISIHSSHTGRDPGRGHVHVGEAISIHSSHTGRDIHVAFLSAGRPDFNPLFPYGKRRTAARRKRKRIQISIHSSHTGRDQVSCSCSLPR